MKKIILAGAALALAALPALAEGDAEKGAKVFKKCKSCHAIVKPDGTAIVKGGKTGPNLYGVIGRPAGSVEGFKYSKSMIEAGEKGLVWDEEKVATFVKDPSGFLKEYLGDSGARSKMTFKLRKGGEDVAAYLASVAEE